MRQIGTWITCMVEQLRSISMYRCIFILSVYRIFKRVSQNNHYFASVRRVCVLSYYYSQWIFLSSTICIYGASCAVLCHPISLQVSGPRVTPMAKKVLSLRHTFKNLMHV